MAAAALALLKRRQSRGEGGGGRREERRGRGTALTLVCSALVQYSVLQMMD